MDKVNLPAEELQIDELTWREQEILALLADRLTNREIADRLHLAESTVKDYVGNILSKLYVKNRRQAVSRAKALGLLGGDHKPEARPPANLPAEPTPFVGRRQELEEIKRYLVGTRLLTLTGPGGIGKTRLALKAAQEVVGDYRDGCTFVSLAPIPSASHIIQAIAQALNFPIATHEDPQHQLQRYLKTRQLLLVMDNFEHLLDGVGLLSEILQAAPALKILATSRERLNLQSETSLSVEGMATPDLSNPDDVLNYDAVTLFVQRARKVRPGFDPSPNVLMQIVNICQVVGGMPLGIELAAAWLHILNVDEIAAELQQGIDILASDVRDLPERHRSMRAIFEASWSMLAETEQEVFKRLSVFRGGFTREAAQQVSEAPLPILAGLVSKSFLSHDPDSGRFEVHELLRQYAQGRLNETPQEGLSAQEAHAAYFAAFMQARWEDLKGKRQIPALAEIEADIENVRAAWRYYIDHRNISQMWKVIYSLWYVYWVRWWNHAGMELFEEAARVTMEEENDEAITLGALAIALQTSFMAWQGLSERGYELSVESVERLQRLVDPQALTFALYGLALNAYFVNRYQEEVKASNMMLKITKELDDQWLIAWALFVKGMGALIMGDYPQAKQSAERSLSLYEEIGDRIGSTLPLIVLGSTSLALDNHRGAREFYLRCLNLSEEVGFHYARQTSCKYLGKVALAMGDILEAENYYLQSLPIAIEIGFMRDIINLLFEIARLRVAQDNPKRAIELLALVIQHPASNETRMFEGRIRDNARDLLAELEAKLPRETYIAAIERGQELDLDEVLAGLIHPVN